MTPDFHQIWDRTQSRSVKWDRYRGRDILPLWVADMDFPAPEAVVSALRERMEHPIFGYTFPPDDLANVVADHLSASFDWQVDPEAIVWLPGVVPGLHVAARMVAGDVMVPTPVYPPFFKVAQAAGKKEIPLPCHVKGGRLLPDFERLKALAPDAGVLLLCSPHNPGGTVFTPRELSEIAAICKRHGTLVCSDEIHADLVLEPGIRHIPFAKAHPETAAVTLMAPSKTFNIPGLGCAFAVVEDPALRHKFQKTADGIVAYVNLFGYTAARAAYTKGGTWLSAVRACLLENRNFLEKRMEAMPGLSMVTPQAGYLAWIHVDGDAIDDPARFFEDHGVGLSDGKEFGAPGWVRINFACPRRTLATALDRMETALREKQK